jgi:hypothetical protein
VEVRHLVLAVQDTRVGVRSNERGVVVGVELKAHNLSVGPRRP